MTRLPLLLSSLLLLAPAQAAPAQAAPPPVSTAVSPPPVPVIAAPTPPDVTVLALPSGAPVWLVERHDLPRVRIELTLQAHPDGLGQWPRSVREAAALAIPDIGRGGGREGWAAAIEARGGQVDAGCGALRCWVDLDVLTPALPAALEVLQRAWASPLPRGAARQPLRDARDAEANLAAWPARVFQRGVDRLWFPPGHPMGASPFPSDTTARALAAVWSAMRAAPAGIVVAGDATPALVPMLAETFGALTPVRVGRDDGPLLPPPARPTPVPSTPAPAPATPEQAPLTTEIDLIDLPDEPLAWVSVGWESPPRGDAQSGGWWLVTEALGGRGRLYQRLRERDGVVYMVSTSSDAGARYGWTEVRFQVAPENVVVALRGVEEELARVASEGITQEELSAIQARALLSGARTLERLSDLCWPLSAQMVWGEPQPSLDWSGLRSFTPAHAQAAAATTLAHPRRVVLGGDAVVLSSVLAAEGREIHRVLDACEAATGAPCPPTPAGEGAP